MADSHRTTSTATVTLTVNVPAETVTAVADTGTASEDGGAISGNVLTNDSVDIDDGPKHVVAASVGTFTSAHGATVTLDASGNYTYDPSTYTGIESLTPGSYSDTFSYTMADSHGTTSTATVTITVNVPAETVTAVADTGTASEDGGAISGNVLTNDSVDIDDGPKHVVAASVGTFTSAHGATVTLDASSNYTYDPSTYTGIESLTPGSYSDTFSYTMADSHGTTSTATVTITVNVPAETVTAVADTGTASEDGGAISGNVLTNDSVDIDDGPKHVVAASVGTFTSAHGATVTLDASSNYTYDPSTYTGIESLTPGSYSDTFSYTMADSHGTTSTATVTITVNVPAETVTAVADTGTASEDGGAISGNVLTNDSVDIDDGPKHVVAASVGTFTSAHGATVTLDASGNYTYDPSTYTGIESLTPGSYSDTFSYTMADSHGTTSAATVTAVADTGTASEDGGAISGNVLTNDSVDIDDGPKHVVAASVGTFTSAH